MNTTRTPTLDELASANAAAMTANDQEPRRHHLLPRFYIDRWAEGGKVQVTNVANERRSWPSSPLNALVEKDFYRMASPGGASPVYWEAWLSQVEGKARAVFASIDAAGSVREITEDEQQWLCFFLGVQMTRTKAARFMRRAMTVEQLDRIFEAGGVNDVALYLGWDGGPFDEEAHGSIGAEIERLKRDPMQVPLSREEDLVQSAKVAHHLGSILATRHLLLCTTDRRLITCDEPVVELHEDHGSRPHRGGVWGAPIMAFPIGPRQVLALYRQDITPPRIGRTSLNSQDVADLNSVILGNAKHAAISTPGDKTAEKLYLPPEAPSVKSAQIGGYKGQESEVLIEFWKPSRWEGDPLAPRRPVNFWWPHYVPPAPSPTAEEQAIMKTWSTE